MEPKYVPIEDVAKHFSVSISTIRAWVRQKQIPQSTYIRVGNTYRFCITDISKALTTKEDEPAMHKYTFTQENVEYAEDSVAVAISGDADLLELLDEDQ